MTFLSSSTLEDFTGVVNKVGGECKIDPTNLEKLSGKFSVRVADMKTGIDLRDQHMRSADWLDAEKFPQIMIEITSAEGVKKTGPNAAEMTLIGKCTIKGTTHDVKLPANLVYLDESPETQRKAKGDLMRLRSEFKLKLSDYGITGPKGSDFIGLKVADTIELRVGVFGSTEKPPEALKTDNGPASRPGVPPPPKRP